MRRAEPFAISILNKKLNFVQFEYKTFQWILCTFERQRKAAFEKPEELHHSSSCVPPVMEIYLSIHFLVTQNGHHLIQRESGMHKSTVECLLTMVWWVKCKARIYKYYTCEHCYCTQAEKSCSNPISGLRCANRGFCRESGIRSHLEHVLEIVSINTAAGLKL